MTIPKFHTTKPSIQQISISDWKKIEAWLHRTGPRPQLKLSKF